MRVLVTGCEGQVGSALLQALAGRYELIATRRSEFDLRDAAGVVDAAHALAPDLIVNAAAYTDVERAESEPELAFAVNAAAVGALARVARERRVPLVHYSTDYVFDGAGDAPYTELDSPRPLSVYGRSKLAGEQMIRDSGCAFLIIRTSWVYAARGRNFLRTMLRLARERDEVRVVDDQHGAPTHARYIARTTAHLLSAMAADADAADRVARGETLNVANAGFTTWHGFARAIFERRAARGRGPAPRLVSIPSSQFPTKARRPHNSRLDLSRLQSIWMAPLQTWQDGLDECLRELDELGEDA